MANPQWWNQSSNRPGMYQRIKVFDVTDFTGGLNLNPDPFRLGPNESPEMLNVDVDRRGGFQLRRGVAPYGSTGVLTNGGTTPVDPTNLWMHYDAGNKYIVAQVGADIRFSTGGATWTKLGTSAGSATAVCRATTFNNYNYIVRGAASVQRFNGSSTPSSMGSAFNDDFLNPTSGNVPQAKVIASHAGYMWVANTTESGTSKPSRIRWSHPNNAENWRADDYIDIDVGKDGDEITALMPIGDHLVVCKRDSMYAIYGYDFNSFSVVNISNTVGCVSQEACVNTQMGVAVFDHTLGLHMYSGKGTPVWSFSQLWPAMRDDTIPRSKIDKVQMGWVNGRLWIGVPWADSPTLDRGTTFVWSPLANSGGSFTRYDLATGPFLTGHMMESSCSAIYGTNRVIELDQDEYWDDFGSGPVVINAYYRTKWFDAGQASMKKRWRRMEAVMQTDQPYELPVEVHYDFDNQSSKRVFSLSTSVSNGDTPEAYWGDDTTRATDTLWGSDFDTFATGEGAYAFGGVRGSVDRGAGLGLARSVSLTFGGKVVKQDTDSTPVFWGVDAIVFKFVPRRTR